MRGFSCVLFVVGQASGYYMRLRRLGDVYERGNMCSINVYGNDDMHDYAYALVSWRT